MTALSGFTAGSRLHVTKILSKLRARPELKIGLDFSVNVPSEAAANLVTDLRQALQELGLGESVRVD